eukprot:m.85803 g.85803  ORF g.85803 m.85803 type:complete len:342 (+) comp36474_c0_seq1:119-1144(+)
MVAVEIRPGIVKMILCEGECEIPSYTKNTRGTFHFRTLAKERDCHHEIVIDDSRTMGCGPFELLIGRKFKLSVWEDLVKTMRQGEKSTFRCSQEFVSDYPLVSKSLRYVGKEKQGKAKEEDRPRQHNCMACNPATLTTGHGDLDELQDHPRELTFEIELLKVEPEGVYEKEVWSMTAKERQEETPKLKERGNALYGQGKHNEAADLYAKAISCIEQLAAQEHPTSDTAMALQRQKIPLLLNYAQCKLHLQEYGAAIAHTSAVLEKEPDNVKALFRRGKAYAGSWQPQLAQRDLKRVVQLDGSLSRAVQRILRELDDVQKERDDEDRTRLQGRGMFRSEISK